MADFSPMMKQYFSIKEKHSNALLFFRLGDFYEMFFEDAKTASRELELTLTGRECGQEERAPMCGVPYHSAEGYIAKLIEKGYKVAICEQTEDPSATKGIVRREVVRVITPGTVLESSMLDEGANNYIASIFLTENSVGLSFCDVSTGELKATMHISKNKEELCSFIIDELSKFSPSEILINPEVLSLKKLEFFIRDKLSCNVECMDEQVFDVQQAAKLLLNNFTKDYLKEISLSEYPMILSALGSLFDYLTSTQKTGIKRLNEIVIYIKEEHMKLDLNTLRNLELTQTMRSKSKKGSLLWVLDKTKTAMGKRLIKAYIQAPLINLAEITRRQNAVEELFADRPLSDEFAEILSGIYDLERIITRVVYGSANPRELLSLCETLRHLPLLKNTLQNCEATMLKDINDGIDLLEDIKQLIESAISDDAPITIKDGGVIKDGYSSELDEIRHDMNGGRDLITEIEQKEKEETGISKLKIKYNRVFGYYLEVPNSFINKVPERYIRRQTLANCERYITEELKILESRVLGASDKSVNLETYIYEQIRKSVADEFPRVQNTAAMIARLDVINSFAAVSRANDYVRPTISVNGKLNIKDGRHPVVEQILYDSRFVPNDTLMDLNDNRIAVITGPNMAGKSTYMRQTAVIVLMAQTGCFVPASTAEVSITDRIFTRVGASDDLSTGQSTFMTEMSEVADILKHATKNSLIVLDEIGRGTSTFDGMSIARAVLEYIYDKKQIGAKTLFATHYHELTDLEELLPGVKNYQVAVKKHGDDIDFLRKILRGGCDDSYGIQVAKLAGVPNKVVNRAKQVLKSLEEGVPLKSDKPKNSLVDEAVQFTFNTPDSEVVTKLKKIDVNTLTPIESMNLLFELKSLLK